MLSYILSFISTKANLLIYPLLIILSFSLGYNVFQYFSISLLDNNLKVLKAEKEQLNLKLIISEESNKELRNAINLQNIYVDNLRNEAEKKLKENAELLNKAKSEATKSKKRAEELMNAKPPANMSLCDAANKLINEEIDALRSNNVNIIYTDMLNSQMVDVP
jgi:23S rRNA-/tRNA-specific pseudouridylate synthase